MILESLKFLGGSFFQISSFHVSTARWRGLQNLEPGDLWEFFMCGLALPLLSSFRGFPFAGAGCTVYHPSATPSAFGAVRSVGSLSIKFLSLAEGSTRSTDNLGSGDPVYLHLQVLQQDSFTWPWGYSTSAVMLDGSKWQGWPAMFAMGTDVMPLTPGTLVNTWSTIEFRERWHRGSSTSFQCVRFHPILQFSSFLSPNGRERWLVLLRNQSELEGSVGKKEQDVTS